MALPPLPNLTVQQLEYLVAVSRAPTWADAANSVGVTPSALSQGLAELERRLGVKIFERRGRRRVISPGALEVLAHAEAMVSRTQDLARWAAGIRTGDIGQVRLGMIDAAAIHHFPDTLRRFRIDRPKVELHLTVAPSAALLAALTQGSLDLAVCVAPPQPIDNLRITNLVVEPLRVYAPPETSPTLAPADWGPWVTFPHGSHSRRIIADGVSALGSSFNVVAESHQPDVLRGMVGMGIGWTVLPVSQAESGLDPLTPARVRPVAERTLVIARRTATVPDSAATGLANALIAASRSAQ